MKRLILSVCASLCLASMSAKEDWQLVWNDEFDYTGAPNSEKWSFDTEGNNWDWGNDEAQNYTPADKKNAWVEDGKLVIEARKEAYTWPGDGQTKQYTSARLRTLGKGDWTYGKVEVKALLPKGRGFWPAIWMLPSEEKYGGWPASGELDIMENVGFDANKIHCNIHTDAYNHKMNTNKGNTVSTSSPGDNWHIYSMEWDEDKVIFFLDGNQVFRFDNEHKSYREWPYDQNFHLLLNVAVGGGWGGEQGIDDSAFPQRMLVDYVRVYQMGEEKPEEVEIKMNCDYEPLVCKGERISIKIDTTGTGSLLHPENFGVQITELAEDGGTRVIDENDIKVDSDGAFSYTFFPKTTAEYECKTTYTTAEGQVYERFEILHMKVVQLPFVYDTVLTVSNEDPLEIFPVVDYRGKEEDYYVQWCDSYIISPSTTVYPKQDRKNSYEYWVTDNTGKCSIQGNIKVNVDPTTSVETLACEQEAVYYDMATECLQNVSNGAVFRIVNAKGDVVMQGKACNGSLNVSALGRGYYVVVTGGKAYPFVK